ncbi:hypothetical protein [Priestia flexa]|uniref:Nucleoside 2-deoxyribosyltransferase n=1 Tax=Priestia flexa TaxID=86664 RepID=A0A8I1MJU1_9BACI|nr:hypothetical protein [Priestia flexa]MBN8253597.1 hypothetical protein [Priestia flexa]
MKKCFIVGPIGEEGSAVRKQADQVFRHIIKPVCESNDYEAIRVDQIHDTDTINQTIINYLEEAELVISDLSGHNPNAFYETGYRLAVGKPLIQLMHEGEALPFDVAGTRTIFYNLSDLDKVSAAKEKLTETIKAVSQEEIPESQKTNETHNSHEKDSKIFSLLLELKDNIQQLRGDISHTNNAMTEQIITTFAKQLQSSSASPEEKLMETFVNQAFSNPHKLQEILALAENFNQTSK